MSNEVSKQDKKKRNNKLIIHLTREEYKAIRTILYVYRDKQYEIVDEYVMMGLQKKLGYKSPNNILNEAP